MEQRQTAERTEKQRNESLSSASVGSMGARFLITETGANGGSGEFTGRFADPEMDAGTATREESAGAKSLRHHLGHRRGAQCERYGPMCHLC